MTTAYLGGPRTLVVRKSGYLSDRQSRRLAAGAACLSLIRAASC